MSFVVAALLAGAANTAAPHPNSFSDSLVDVRGDRIVVHLDVQVLSVAEVVADFDDDLDGHTDRDELERAAPAILDYIAEHYRLVPAAADVDAASDRARALAVVDGSVVEGELRPDPLNVVADWLAVRLEFERPPGGFDRLGVFVDLFQTTSPGHRDACTVLWNGEAHTDTWHFALGQEAHVFVATPAMLARNAPVLRRFALNGVRWLGTSHALGLGLLALLGVLGARRSFGSAALTTVGLAGAAAAGIVLAPRLPVADHARFLTLTVPLALVYLGLDDLLHREGRTRLLEAAVFGFVAGASAAVSVADVVVLEEGPYPALYGQAAGSLVPLTVGAMGLAALVLRAGTPERDALAPRGLRVLGALAGIGAGALLFARAF